MDRGKEHRKIRLVLLEDNVLDVELILRELRAYGFALDWTRLQTEREFLAALEESPDVILADCSMPGFNGMDAVELTRTRGLDIPVLLVSGVLGEDTIVMAIKQGAEDIVFKDRLFRLGPAVVKALQNKELRQQYRRVEEEKNVANNRFRQLAQMQEQIFNSLPAHIALLDSDGTIVMVNDAWRQFGSANGLTSPNYAVGQNYLAVCRKAEAAHCDQAGEVASCLTRLLQGEMTEFAVEYACHAPAQERWFRMMTNRLSKSNGAGAVIMHVDITEQKLAADTLRQSERKQRQLVQQIKAERSRLIEAQTVAKVGSWETNASTLEVLWSEETFRIFETTPTSFQPTHAGFLELVHPDDREMVDVTFRDSLKSEGTYSLEHRLLLSGGVTKFVEERWQVVCDENNLPVRAVGTCRDVTENRILQQQLLQSQKMEAIGLLAGGVAHDFNNLLTVILGYTDILMRQTSTTDPMWGMLNDIDGSAKRAASLTRQLLAFSRQQVLNPQVLDLNAVVRDLEKMLQRLIGEDIDLKFVLRPIAGRVRMDPSHLEQIIINLVVNARDAMPKGGCLCIETATTEINRTDAARLSIKPGRYLSLNITDSGTGMTEEVKLRIFEPFFTTKAPGKGTGLGLPTVFGIVKQCGGLIDLESQVGVGTRFQILLPAVMGKAMAAPKDEPTVASGSETILLVEDEAVVRRATKFILESHGYKVMLASNGQEAIDLVRSTSEPFQLLITDVVMPIMGGRVLVEHLRRDHPVLKVLFVSGYTDDAILKHGILESRDAFLQKPFTPLSLSTKVREILDA